MGKRLVSDAVLIIDKMLASKTPEDLKKYPPKIPVVIPDPTGKTFGKVISVRITKERFPKI